MSNNTTKKEEKTKGSAEKLENLKTEEKPSWGGSREGSGRKPKLQYEVRELFNLTIDEEWENVSKVLRYYIRKADKDMVKWIVEQRIGRAPQSVDVTAKTLSVNLTPENMEMPNKTDVMEIAKRVSAELKRIKTMN